MIKLFLLFTTILITINSCLAENLELSEKIKAARDSEIMKIAEEAKTKNSIQPVKNESTQYLGEKNLSEKINPNDNLENK